MKIQYEIVESGPMGVLFAEIVEAEHLTDALRALMIGMWPVGYSVTINVLYCQEQS